MSGHSLARRRSASAAAAAAALLLTLAGTARAQQPLCSAAPAPAGPPRTVLTCGGITIEVEEGAAWDLIDHGRDGELDALRLGSGGALIDYGTAPRRRFQILTPHAIASVRGTVWAVDVTPRQSSVFVVEGTVAVSRSDGGEAVQLQAGDGTDVAPGTAPLTVRRWAEARARALLARFGR